MNMKSGPDEQAVKMRVPGDLVSTNAEAVRQEIEGMLTAAETACQKWTVLTLDLGAAKMIDSVGMNLVVYLLKRVRARGATLRVGYSNSNILRTFTFTRLDRHVELVKI